MASWIDVSCPVAEASAAAMARTWMWTAARLLEAVPSDVCALLASMSVPTPCRQASNAELNEVCAAACGAKAALHYARPVVSSS